MSIGNTLMVGNMIGSSWSSNDNGGLEPKPWWILAFMISFVVFEFIKLTFFR